MNSIDSPLALINSLEIYKKITKARNTTKTVCLTVRLVGSANLIGLDLDPIRYYTYIIGDYLEFQQLQINAMGSISPDKDELTSLL